MRRPQWQKVATVLGIAAIAAAALVSARQGPLEPPSSAEADGYASVFVPADVMRARLPLRAPLAFAGSAVRVEIKVDGSEPQAATVGDAWQNVDLVLRDSSAAGRFHRIDVQMSDGRIEIGEVQAGFER